MRAAAQAPHLEQAATLLREGRPQEAWQLLAPHENDFAGREDYDYLLAIAALESGRPNLATFVLERVLAVNPNHSAARLEMGRAYFALGDYQRARVEFESVLRFDPPPHARATIERYLAEIDTHTSGRRAYLSAHVEATWGRDTNVNSATSQESVFVPLVGLNVTLGAAGTRQRDSFAAFGAGLDWTYPLGTTMTLVAGGDFRQRVHGKVDAFDSRSADLRIGLNRSFGEHDLVRVVLGHGEYDLDNKRYRWSQSLAADWGRQLDRGTRLSLFGYGARLRYVQEPTRSSSSNLFLIGVGGTRVLDEASRSVLYGSIYRGDDNATEGRVDGDRVLTGGRVTLQRALRPSADAYLSVAWQDSRYELQNIFFSTLRRDRQLDLALGMSWRIGRAWVVRPQISWTRNDSSIVLNEYSRREASISARYTWN